ncbi:UNVERIFIED_CONTAM: restriction endonuclease subunit S [Mammaliicoccus sciuri]
MEFKEYKLADITKKIYSGGTPSTRESSYWNGDLKWLSSGETSNRFIMSTEKTITQKGVENSSTKLAYKHDLVMASAGQGYTRGQTSFLKIDTYINQSLIAISVNKNEIHPLYLFYNLVSRYDELRQISDSSSTRGSINTKMIKNLNIMIPEKSYQNRIVYLINSIDEKIEINKKIIENLEELSQTLFKRWFVDFEFPDENGNPYKSSGGEMVDSELGEIPKGWNVKNLDDIANYVNGLAMQKFKPTDNQNSLPVVKIKELKNGSTDENSNRCTSEIPDKALINDGDIIFSWSATLLVKMWCGGKAGLNQHLFKVSSDKYPKWFYYYWTKRYIDYFIGIANDKATTMGHINRKHLSHAKILIPNDSTLEKFSRTFDDLLEKELSVSKESKRLIELRDTLLPKLMSGEIEIPDDIEVNEDELSI